MGVLQKRDQHHDWAKRQFDRVVLSLYTCEAALSDFHVVEAVSTGSERLLTVLEREILDLFFSSAQPVARIHDLMRTYPAQPMSLADACLVQRAERHSASFVVTTDPDFRVYRKAGDEPLDVRLPDKEEKTLPF